MPKIFQFKPNIPSVHESFNAANVAQNLKKQWASEIIIFLYICISIG